MPTDPDIDAIVSALKASIGHLTRRLRQVRTDGELTLPETSVLARLDRDGPATLSALARAEQISPQSMGATLATLERRGLLRREPDAADGRRIVLSPTAAGLQALRSGRAARSERLAAALAGGFTPAELRHLFAAAPLIERLAQRL